MAEISRLSWTEKRENPVVDPTPCKRGLFSYPAEFQFPSSLPMSRLPSAVLRQLMLSLMVFGHPSLSPRPVRGLSSGYFNNLSGEEALPSKEASDAGSVRTSLLPTSQKTLNANYLSFCFCPEYFVWWIPSHNDNIFKILGTTLQY